MFTEEFSISRSFCIVTVRVESTSLLKIKTFKIQTKLEEQEFET